MWQQNLISEQCIYAHIAGAAAIMGHISHKDKRYLREQLYTQSQLWDIFSRTTNITCRTGKTVVVHGKVFLGCHMDQFFPGGTWTRFSQVVHEEVFLRWYMHKLFADGTCISLSQVVHRKKFPRLYINIFLPDGT